MVAGFSITFSTRALCTADGCENQQIACVLSIRGYSCYNTKSRTVDDRGYLLWKMPRSLHVGFEKE